MYRLYFIIITLGFVNFCNAQSFSKDLEKAARTGDASAQYQLGMAYAIGNGVSRSNADAILWMEKSAIQGYEPAINKIASFYYNLEMFDKSIEWYTKLADEGDVMAEYWLGHCYYQKKDGQSSIKWFEKVANTNDGMWSVTASYDIGEIYAEGKIIKTDYDLALLWFKRAALEIHKGAMTEIDKIYYYKLCKEESDSEKRFWCEKLAKDDYSSGYNGLGEIYMREKNYSKAYDMFSKAIEKNNNTAVGNMGEMYYYGYFVEKNNKKAFNLLEQSATDTDCPNANAMRLLSACYRYGLGTEKNLTMEKQWMGKAAQYRDKKAMDILGLQ